MITLNEKTIIPSPPATVWPLLRDPALVASCIPGAELSPDSGDGAWRGSIKVKFGPTVASFRGEASLKFDDDAMICTVEGRGIDQRGASRALASGKLTVTGDTETTLFIEGEFNVTGPLETFANAGGVHVARALLGEFSTNLTNLVSAQDPGANSEPSADNCTDQTDANSATEDAPTIQARPATPARELSAFSILIKAFKSWLGSLFGTKGQ
ncbi:MAG: SRPBCC family protein [Alphaproteobacteria bacterium]|jgi:carbon monoxide dehydrogenase subunit G